MIIPIRCFSCGMVLADKYRFYQTEVRKRKIANGERLDKVVYLNKQNMGQKTIEGETMDSIGIKNVCCRRHILTHVDIY